MNINQVFSVIRNAIGGVNIAIDPGTKTTRIAIPNKGIVLKEPTFIGLNTSSNTYSFFGKEAKNIYGKAPEFIQISKPIKHSTIYNFDSFVELMKYFFSISIFPYYSKKLIIKTNSVAYTVCPTSSTEVEERAIEEGLIKAGMLKTIVIEKTIASAVGCGLPVLTEEPIFIIDLGAGLFEISIILMGGIVQGKSLKIAGDSLDKTLLNYINLKHGVILGENTAEEIKNTLFSFNNSDESLVIRGKSIENGLPKSIRIKASEVKEALIGQFMYLIEAAKEIIESAPPEIIDDTVKRGVILTGAIAKSPGIDKYISNELKIPVLVPENPDLSTIHGLQKIASDKPKYNRLHFKI